MANFIGLEALRSGRRDAVLWEDLGTIVERMGCDSDPRNKVNLNHGLGTFIYDTLKAHPQWSESNQQRFVGIEVTKAFNGLLRHGAYEQDIFGGDVAFKQGGDVCIGQHRLRRCSSSNLPEDKWVSVGEEKYPSICFGRCTFMKVITQLDEKDEEVEVEEVIKIRGHRLACWLRNGNPRGGTRRQQEVVCHACVGKPYCVRLECLTWDSQGANTEVARLSRKRRRWR